MNDSLAGVQPSGGDETCTACGQRLSPVSGWQVQRICGQCGQDIYLAEPGEDGKGLKVQQGDRFHIPAGSIRMSLDPRKASTTFTRAGASWFVELLHMQGLAKTVDELDSQLEYYDKQATDALKSSPLLRDVDFDGATAGDEIFRIVGTSQATVEYAAFQVVMLVGFVQDAIAEGDTRKAAWLMGHLAVTRSLFLHRDNLEETLWRGYTLGGFRRLYDLWLENKDNAHEEYWQEVLTENAIVLSQVFSFPVIVLKDKAYVGGKGISNSGGKIVDFLLANGVTQNAAIVEIKTPKTRLLGTEYRQDIFSISEELTGAVNQAATYKDNLLKTYTTLAYNSDQLFDAFSPQCLVIAGTLEGQVKSKFQRRSFELFRLGLRDVQVLTFDEVFHKVKVLVDLLEGETPE